jgi:hypothetical protein
MKFVSKFKLETPLAWQGCVAPDYDFLLGLDLLFPMVNLETKLFNSNSRRDNLCRKS